MEPEAISEHAQHRRRRSDIALRRLAEGITPHQIQADFVAWGVPAEEARYVVADALDRQRRDGFRHKVQPVWVGGSMLLVGVLLTYLGMLRSDLADARIHRFLLLGLMILPAAAAYGLFGLAQILLPDDNTQAEPVSLKMPQVEEIRPEAFQRMAA